VSRSQCGGSPKDVITVFWTGAATFSLKYLLNCAYEAEWTTFQTHYFSKNLVGPGIEPGSVTRNPDHSTIEAAVKLVGK
jgi:hypothetical protein